MHDEDRSIKQHAYALILWMGMSASSFGFDVHATDLPGGVTAPPPHAEQPGTATKSSGDAASPGSEGDPHEDWWNAHFQSTYVWQHKDAFSAPYTGAQSLRTLSERSYSITATAYLGARLWHGAEVYFNPEAAQGLPFSNLFGLAG